MRMCLRLYWLMVAMYCKVRRRCMPRSMQMPRMWVRCRSQLQMEFCLARRLQRWRMRSQGRRRPMCTSACRCCSQRMACVRPMRGTLLMHCVSIRRRPRGSARKMRRRRRQANARRGRLCRSCIAQWSGDQPLIRLALALLQAVRGWVPKAPCLRRVSHCSQHKTQQRLRLPVRRASARNVYACCGVRSVG